MADDKEGRDRRKQRRIEKRKSEGAMPKVKSKEQLEAAEKMRLALKRLNKSRKR